VLLEARLRRHDSVRDARASAVTGRVLVLFDARRVGLRDVLAFVEKDLDGLSAASAVASSTAAVAPHARSADEVLAALGTSRHGLSAENAEQRARRGRNELPAVLPKSALEIIAAQVSSVPVLLLGVAAGLSLIVGAPVDAVVIGAVVVANTVVGYVTERRVDRILAAVKRRGDGAALVRRDGVDQAIDAAWLVPGDVIVLRAGGEVPADARLLESDGLAVDESALTGESAPIGKVARMVIRAITPVADRCNMVFAGSVIAEGTAVAVVTATGQDTEIGVLHTLVAQAASPPTPLERQLDGLGRQLVGISLGCCGVALILGLARGIPALAMLRTVISLGVAAVPEGLPAVATTTLALGMQRMLRARVLVRRLGAVEGLGAVTVICVDKTGTLTENRMSVAGWYLGGEEYGEAPLPVGGDATVSRALAVAVLCNDAELNGHGELRGTSTEGALLLAAARAGADARVLRDRFPRVGARPRHDGETWMGTVHETRTGGRLVTVKGAPEDVLARSGWWLDGDTERPLDARARARMEAASGRFATEGMRVLGLAFKTIEVEDGASCYEDLVWVGLVALRDPVRPGVREAIAACQAAGIRIVMLTGDHAETASAVARQLGIGKDAPRVADTTVLATGDEAAVRGLVREVDVFARVSPAHKYRIVRALQEGGDVVAMTGDGVNDAAALRAADVGVAMGARGTDVARDVADVVLVDDDFAGMVSAIEQGRTIRTNVGRALRFLLATNASEIVVTLGALAVGGASPLSAIQFLWINLLSDVAPGLALAVEPAEPDVMLRPPRDPAEPMLNREGARGMAVDAGWLSASTLLVHALAVARYGSGARAGSIAFSTLTTGQLLYAFRCTSDTRRGPLGIGGPLLTGVVGGSMALQIAVATLPPLRGILGLTPLAAGDWLLVGAGALMPFVTRLWPLRPTPQRSLPIRPTEGHRHGTQDGSHLERRDLTRVLP
jgi:P-type Ca2+ transporter type 2C